jgi:hypothetical protein
MEKRKEQARLMKEYEENKEEIEKMQEQIPEWKRGAVTISDKPPEEEKKGIFKRMTSKVTDKISKTKAAQEFMESEQYKNIQKMRSEMQEFKSNLKDEMDTT